METAEKEIRDIKAWNEAMVKKYDVEAYYESNFAIRWIEKLRINTVIKAIRNQAAGRVLEVGCGAGHVLERVPRGEIVGIDLSNHMVKRTRERLKNKKVFVLQANADHLPFQKGVFDSVICTEVLEHVEHPDQILGEILRVARPTAHIALSVPNEKLINRVKDWIIRMGLGGLFFKGEYNVPERMDDEWHLHVFDLKDLIRQLSSKFLIEKVTPIPSPLLPLRHVISCSPRP